MKIFSLIFCLFLLFGCTGEKKRYSATELWFKALKFDETIEQVPIPQHEAHRRILCQNYGDGCVPGSGKRILIRKVELIAVEFIDEEHAKAEALRLNGYFFKNWFFDDVTGEPVLESFVKEAFGAQNPRLP